VLVVVLVLEFGLQLVSEESRANNQRLYLKNQHANLYSATTASAILLNVLDGPAAKRG
jgi:hypothetical protein